MLTPTEIAVILFVFFIVIKFMACIHLFVCSQKAQWQSRRMGGGMERFAVINANAKKR